MKSGETKTEKAEKVSICNMYRGVVQRADISYLDDQYHLCAQLRRLKNNEQGSHFVEIGPHYAAVAGPPASTFQVLQVCAITPG